MSGIYTVQFSNIAVTTNGDLFEVVAHATKILVVVAYGLSQNTELGDAAEESLRITLKSGQTAAGATNTSYTPVPTDGSSAAAGFTSLVADATNATPASGGTINTHYTYNWNIRMPFDIILPEPMQIILPATRRATLTLEASPADSVTMSGYMVLQEIG